MRSKNEENKQSSKLTRAENRSRYLVLSCTGRLKSASPPRKKEQNATIHLRHVTGLAAESFAPLPHSTGPSRDRASRRAPVIRCPAAEADGHVGQFRSSLPRIASSRVCSNGFGEGPAPWGSGDKIMPHHLIDGVLRMHLLTKNIPCISEQHSALPEPCLS